MTNPNPLSARRRLGNKVLEEFGGPDVLAKAIVRTYRESPPGSPERTELLYLITDLLKDDARDTAPKVLD